MLDAVKEPKQELVGQGESFHSSQIVPPNSQLDQNYFCILFLCLEEPRICSEGEIQCDMRTPLPGYPTKARARSSCAHTGTLCPLRCSGHSCDSQLVLVAAAAESEFLRLASKIIDSNHSLSTTLFTTEPRPQVPHPQVL